MMMAFSKESQTAAAMLLVVVLLLAAEAAAADEKACMSSIVSLMPCLPYTENKAPEPSAPCCRNLAQVVQSQPICLCAVLDGEASQWMGIPVNVSRALALPPACSVQTPPTSECNSTAGSPSASPAASSTPRAPPSGVHSGAAFTKSNIFPACLGLLPALLLYLAGF